MSEEAKSTLEGKKIGLVEIYTQKLGRTKKKQKTKTFVTRRFRFYGVNLAGMRAVAGSRGWRLRVQCEVLVSNGCDY